MRGDRAIRTVQSMTITPVQQNPDTATVEDLAAAFNRSFETCEDPDQILSTDVFFDLFPPFWRFQLQGRDAIQQQLRKLNEGCEVTSRILRVVPTSEGFLLEHEETSCGEHTEIARKLWHCVVRNGQIVEATCYSTADGTTSSALATPPKPRFCDPETRQQ
jgi:hypothetical protein